MTQPPFSGGKPPHQEMGKAERTLSELLNAEPARAYQQLLSDYAAVIQQMIKRFFRDPDEVMEVFVDICERLQAREYSALRSFKGGSPIKPWLSVIAANASRDRLRRSRAGELPPLFASKLSAFERVVYRCYYRHQMSHEEIALIATADTGEHHSASEVGEAISRIDEMLGAERRWRLVHLIALRAQSFSVDVLIESGKLPGEETADWNDEALLATEQKEMLARAFQAMEPEDRLILQLRFEQDLTAVQIAEILGYENYRQVYTRLTTIIDRMRRLLKHSAP